MENENELIVVQDVKKDLSINQDDVVRVGTHLELIRDFVKSKMHEGIDKDFAVIPGTRTKSLLQPGAQKLMKLFGLGVRYEQTDKEFDRYENFALYSYKATVYHLQSGIEVAQCEGTANSMERKYIKSQVCDILNTLKKMAQKRAMVGAVITAVGASDYFSQDGDEVTNQRGHRKVDVPQGNPNDPGNYQVTVGQYKNMRIKNIPEGKLKGYVKTITENNKNIDGPLKEFLDKARDYLKSV